MIPEFYTAIRDPEIEALNEVPKPIDQNEDILPFVSLGGRRFEILSYLLTISEEPLEESDVTLVKSSGDSGRDVVVSQQGCLRRVIQCKALDKSLSKPALLREIVKLTAHNLITQFIPENQKITYEIWAPGDLTQPAQELVDLWPNSLKEDDIRKAFDKVTSTYTTLSELNWTESRDSLLDTLQKQFHLRKREGIALTHAVRKSQSIHTRFFEAKIVLDEAHTRKAIADMFADTNWRHIVDDEVRVIIDGIQSFPSEERLYLGAFVFGLKAEHYAMLSSDEQAQFLKNCSKATFDNLQILIHALIRRSEEIFTEASTLMYYDNNAFRLVLKQVVTLRLLTTFSRLMSPNILPKVGWSASIGRSLDEIINDHVVSTWPKFDVILSKYDPVQHSKGSDEWLRARISHHARLGFENKEEFEASLRHDFVQNRSKIQKLDEVVCELVPERLVIFSDTKTVFDESAYRDQLLSAVERIANVKKKRQQFTTKNTGSELPAPKLDAVTWERVEYEKPDGSYFRGYHKAIVFSGHNFGNELEFAHRRQETKQERLFWRKVNLSVPSRAEVASGGDEIEGPLSWRGYEFAVRRPGGPESNWVLFDYPWDYKLLREELEACADRGEHFMKQGAAKEAVEPFRRAMVFSDRLDGIQAPRTQDLRKRHNNALDAAALARLSCREGDQVRIVEGKHSGKTGTIVFVHLRATSAYQVVFSDDRNNEDVWLSEKQVELLS